MALAPVVIHEIENPGKFYCHLKRSEEDSCSYLDFLSSLNTYFGRRKGNVAEQVPGEIGAYVAVHVAIGEAQELWYRGKIMNMYQRPEGVIAQLLLVDEGQMVCTPKPRTRALPEKFLNYPHQVMCCVLSEIVPITLGTAIDLRMSLKKTQHWDSSAKKFIQSLLKDADTYVETVSVDQDNVCHVNLYISDESNSMTNVNELLIQQKYATRRTMDDLTLSQQSILVEKKKEKKDVSSKITTDKEVSKDISVQNPKLAMYKAAEREKQKQKERARVHADKDVADLLKLINGGYDEIPSSSQTRISEGSELSDMDSSPAPSMIKFKSIRAGLNDQQVSNKIADHLGQESSDFLAKGFGMFRQNPKSPQKRVTFSEEEECFGGEKTSAGCGSNSGKFDFHNSSAKSSDKDKEHTAGTNVDSSYILQALSVGTTSVTTKKSSPGKFSDDVLVQGKLKREPLQSVNDLNLPLQLKTSLADISGLSSTPFQKHMWSYMASFRNVVGIADVGDTNQSRVLAYLLPILRNMLQQEGSYNSMGKGNKPFLIICVAGWLEAQRVYDICEDLTKCFKKVINIDVRYGGMDRLRDRNIRLINGCDLLITTLPSLNHVVAKDLIQLDRLCHIIFDDADVLVEKFTEDIKVFMRTYAESFKKSGNSGNNQIAVVGKKWSYGIGSFMKSYLEFPLVIIANRIEAALFAKVPIIPEICNEVDRMESLIGFLEEEAADENSIIFTNSAAGAETLHENLKTYSIITNVMTDYTTPLDMRDTRTAWNAACVKAKSNILILSDNAALQANIKNATCVIHYDYPQKKSHFGNRLACLLDTIRENENKSEPKPLFSQIFITEKNNGVRYCTGLVKLLKRSGQNVPEMLKSMASSSHELKEEQKKFSEICPRLKLFGECSHLNDCMERHTLFEDKDLLGLCPSTGFIKILILDVVSASNFWGRIVEHRLPYDPEGSSYDTTTYLALYMDMQAFYGDADSRRLCCSVEKYDVCVMNTIEAGYQRVRIEKILEKENERPTKLEVFGIDNGFTSVIHFNKLYILDDQFKKIPPQAVEVIACCVKPIERGDSWTNEASKEVERRAKGKTLEGRVQFSLQNTIWVDPLVEKKMMSGIQTKTYSFDIGRDLLNLGFAEKNLKHVDKLRKLLFDVQGCPIEITGNKQNLPVSMIYHEKAYLADDDYEDVYVSAVVDPGLFFVTRAENSRMIERLNDKIHATMSVKNTDSRLVTETFPVGYIGVAKFPHDQKWYRAQILGISKDQSNYDVFFVDHGDRDMIGKSKFAAGWPDILTEPFQAMECSFKNIVSIDSEWTLEDGDVFWDLIENKLLSAKVVATPSISTYITLGDDNLSYEVELFDTTCNQTQNISHELVFLGVAQGSLQCLQEMFPHASISQSDKVIKDEVDRCPDLCVEIHREQDVAAKIEKAKQLKSLLLSAPLDSIVLVGNGSIESVCKLLALSKTAEIQEELLSALLELVSQNETYGQAVEDNDGIKALCEILKKTTLESLQNYIVQVIQFAANDKWSMHVLLHMAFIDDLCHIIENSRQCELLMSVLDALVYFCKDNESNCTAVRHANGLEALCNLFDKSTEMKVTERCTYALQVVLSNTRNKDKICEIGGLQILASLSHRNLNEASLKNILTTLLKCIEDHEVNRDYLHKINAHQNLMTISKSQRKFSMVTRILLNDLIHKLQPAPLTEFLDLGESEINPCFELQTDEAPAEDCIIDRMTPKTMWSQRRNTVAVSIVLRGVKSEQTSIGCKTINFRTVLERVEYVLNLELYAKVNERESMVAIKGGEVLITLFKGEPGVIWPRLVASPERIPYITIDFDRWVDELPESEERFDTGDSILFQPDLPKPPTCTSYLGEPISVYEPGLTSSGDSSSSDEEEMGNVRAHEDYFNI